MMKFSKYSVILLFLFSNDLFASNTIVGRWKSIDDQTGFSKGIVEIYKEVDGSYSGKVYAITPQPGYSPREFCNRCLGENRNKPTVGLRVLQNFKLSDTKTDQYINGTILDPSSGKVYKGTLNLRANGKRLALRGYVGLEVVGRSQTWIRSE